LLSLDNSVLLYGLIIGNRELRVNMDEKRRSKAGEIGTQDCQFDVKMLLLKVGIQNHSFRRENETRFTFANFLK
jgi:hypothetical protein